MVEVKVERSGGDIGAECETGSKQDHWINGDINCFSVLLEVHSKVRIQCILNCTQKDLAEEPGMTTAGDGGG